MDNRQRALELGQKPVGRLLWQYALPAIVAMTASSLYNIIDRAMIGQVVGADAIAGLGITFPFMNLSAAFGAAVGGSEFARSGYRFMYGNADDWSTVESIHREQIQHRMDKDQAGQEEVEDALFTSGGIIGSSAFVEELTRRERVAFPRERKSSPQEVCVGDLKLFALRHLKAFRK